MNFKLDLSNPIVAMLHNYFTNFNDTISRKTFTYIMLILTVFLFSVYFFGTNVDQVQTVSQDFGKYLQDTSAANPKLTQEQVLEEMLKDEDTIMDMSERLNNSMPSILWMCLVMLVSIPAIIKRTNDCIFARSHSYPVVILYALLTVQALTGINFAVTQFTSLMLATLNIYTFLYLLIIAFMPTKQERNT